MTAMALPLPLLMHFMHSCTLMTPMDLPPGSDLGLHPCSLSTWVWGSKGMTAGLLPSPHHAGCGRKGGM